MAPGSKRWPASHWRELIASAAALVEDSALPRHVAWSWGGSNAVVHAAEAAGAKLVRPVETKFYGDRMGTITDPFGHVWHVSTHVEDLPPEEIERRAAALSK